jgi:fucose permease
MSSDNRSFPLRPLAVLHSVFLLTGVLHVVGGPLLPSLAATFHLRDNQSGLLFLVYFAGSSFGAALCVGRYARAMTVGFVLVVFSCVGVICAGWPLMLGAFAILGVGVGLAMSAVSLFVGRGLLDRSAPVLVLLNFTWSLGALLAPLLAALVLARANFRVAYALLAMAAAIAALACFLLLRDTPEISNPWRESGTYRDLSAIALFGFACFLQVGIENTSAAWLTTYILRITQRGPAFAATLSALYWAGFLLSRASASYLLLRLKASVLVRISVPAAFAAAILLFASRIQSISCVAMFILGAALGPIYPLLVGESFCHVRRVADSRWILASAGFGGSILPWLTGWISAWSGSIRTGILTLPAALVLMIVLLPLLFRSVSRSPQRQQ